MPLRGLHSLSKLIANLNLCLGYPNHLRCKMDTSDKFESRTRTMDLNEIKRSLSAIVERQSGEEIPAFGDALARLDALATDPQTDLHPRLRHYLERRSYGKALEWLRETED